MDQNNFSWNATAFFKRLVQKNRLAVDGKFEFRSVSSLEGFLTALPGLLSMKGMVAVCDTSDGRLSLDNTPHNRRVKTIYLARRHKVDSDEEREAAMAMLRELFRQFMSVLMQEKIRLEQQAIIIDSNIAFQEIDKYFFTGAACACFHITVSTFTNLAYNPDEWIEPML